MRLYIAAIYAWQTARNDKAPTTRPFAFVLRARLSAPAGSFCLTCITATELPVEAKGGAEGKRGVRRGVDQSQRMTSEAAANLGFE